MVNLSRFKFSNLNKTGVHVHRYSANRQAEQRSDPRRASPMREQREKNAGIAEIEAYIKLHTKSGGSFLCELRKVIVIFDFYSG
jgi:hypothetical protein